jgi:hypothetical protein
LPASLLTPLQQQVLETFFRREQRFFLSGGAALAGFHLAHRRTHELGATVEKIQTTPDFRRRIVRRGEEAVVIDLVHERAPQGPLPKERIGNIRVDPPQEILANKLCTLLSRSELRDLVDVYALERAGLRVEDALPLAEKKDAGLTPAQLAWVLSQIDLASLPEGEPVLRDALSAPTRGELAAYVAALGKRLVTLALPPR